MNSGPLTLMERCALDIHEPRGYLDALAAGDLGRLESAPGSCRSHFLDTVRE
jgi:hypothetical protein